MTLPCRQPAPKWHALAILASSLAPILAGCSGAAAPVQLPPKPPTLKTVVVSKQPTLRPRQQVVAALTGYTAALRAANLSRNALTAKRLLRPYLSAARIDSIVRTEQGIWSKGETAYGQDVLHILSVRIVGSHAFVHDCDNTSTAGLADIATGQRVPGSTGIPDLNIVTRLNLVNGHWTVDFQLVEDVPCTA
jgi:hypothetical protein